MYKNRWAYLVSTAFSILLLSTQSWADAPPQEAYQETIPVHEQQQRLSQTDSCWNTRLSAGYSVFFFDDEDNTGMPGAYLDLWCSENPLNFRVGVEGRHMDLSQEAALASSEFPGKTVEATFIRIPFALEYYQPLAEQVTLFLGGGPDIIHTANDVSDTSVGLHLSARIAFDMNEHWGFAVESGYMWADVDGEGSKDINLDGAFVSPQLYYSF